MKKEEFDKIKQYVKLLLPTIDNSMEINEDLLEFVINDTVDRINLYLNRKELIPNIERIVANTVIDNLKKVNAKVNEMTTGESDKNILSISDNGQSITYSNEIKKYFATNEDNEILGGLTTLLKNKRRPDVYTEKF